MSNYCPLPFLHLNLKQEGKVSACWRYPDRIGDYTNESLQEIWNGEKLNKLRNDLKAGNRPIGCRSCWDMEDSGIKSTRQQAIEDYKNYNINNTIQSIEVRFDNICNLMCRHCSPDYSSKWEHAVKKNKNLNKLMIENGTYRKSDRHISLNQETIDQIIELAPNLKEILIAGGEPLYHEKHYQFIERLLPYARNIKLSYNSNFTTLDYKGKNIINLWKHFKKVLVRVSIDGDDSCYEYVRTHNNLKQVENNIKIARELKNIKLSATCTTSMLNITKFPEIILYFNSLGVHFHASIVQYPLALNPKLLPVELKDQVTDRYLSVLSSLQRSQNYDRIKKYGDNVIDYMNSDDIDKFDMFLDYCTSLDQFHKTDLFSVYPEFKPFAPNI